MDGVEQMEERAYVLRPGTPEDEAYVRDTWRRSYGDGARAQAPDLETYIRTQNQVIDAALATSEVLIAHWPGEPRQIVAWACYRRPSTLHYVYVKAGFRRHGYARAILHDLHEAMGAPPSVYVTHHWRGCPTEAASQRLADTFWTGSIRVKFNPGLVFA